MRVRVNWPMWSVLEVGLIVYEGKVPEMKDAADPKL